MKYSYIFLTIFFTVYGQIILKWRVNKYPKIPADSGEKIMFIIKMLLDPFIISGFASAFIASLFWMLAMTKFNLSFAYPFMSLSFVIVLILSVLIFKESFTVYKVVGLSFILAGIVITSRSL